MRAHALHDLLDAIRELAHELELSEPRHTLQESARRRRAIELPAVHLFFIGRHWTLFRAGEMECLPAQRPLLLENRQRAESITAVQRNRVIEYVQNTHETSQLW